MHVTISQKLFEATGILQHFLSQVLPTLSRNWWNDLVLRHLTPQQLQSAKERNVKSLSGLDLKALLRVLERNWSPIRGVKHLPYNDLNYVKEMSDVRNRWAHMTTEEVPEDDIYRDLDTLQRFASAIEAGPEYINSIKKAKVEVFPSLMLSDPPAKGKIEIERTPSDPLGRTAGKSTRRVIHTSRRPRDPQLEAALKEGVGQLLSNALGETFIGSGQSLLVFRRSGKRFLCKYSSFRRDQSRWWWGVPRLHWTDWGPQDSLVLIMENHTGEGYSYLLLDSKESKELFSRCGDSDGEKKINMRVYMHRPEIRIVEWQELCLAGRIKRLKNDPSMECNP